jgi:hypothetical protein
MEILRGVRHHPSSHFFQILVGKLDYHGAFSDGRGDPLDRS